MKLKIAVMALVAILGLTPCALGSVYLYTDSAPNAYAGGSGFDAWKDAAFYAAATGTFVNMANGINPDNVGTTDFEIEDEVVYSFPDYGKRLHWIYWVPGETISSLDGDFAISLFNYWGDEPVLDFYYDYYGSTWLQPGSWVDYDIENDGVIDGVIGTAGMAWWGAYETNTPDELAEDIAAWRTVDEDWEFNARLGDEITTIVSHRTAVPEPATMGLLASGLIGLGIAGWIRRRKS